MPNTAYGFYAQDDWRVSDSLTLNLGLRYDVEIGALSNAEYGDTGEFLLTDSRSPFFQQGSCASGNRGGGCIADDTNNIAPRLGFAWDVGAQGKTVVRGGYGVFYDKVIGLSTLFTQLDAGGVEFVFLINPPFGPANQPSLEELLAGGAIPLSFDETPVPGFQNPRSDQFSIGASHQLTPTLAIDADFIYSRDVNRNKESDVNEMAVANDATSRLFYPERQGGLLIEESIGENSYKGLQLSLRKRFSNRHPVRRENYTLSEGREASRGPGVSLAYLQASAAPAWVTMRTSVSSRARRRHLYVGSSVFALPAGSPVLAPLLRATAVDATRPERRRPHRGSPPVGPGGKAPGRGKPRAARRCVDLLKLRELLPFRERRRTCG